MMNRSYETSSKLMLDHCLCTIEIILIPHQLHVQKYFASTIWQHISLQFKAGDAIHCVESAVTESVPGDAIHCLESAVIETLSLPEYGDFAVENVSVGWAADAVTRTFVG